MSKTMCKVYFRDKAADMPKWTLLAAFIFYQDADEWMRLKYRHYGGDLCSTQAELKLVAYDEKKKRNVILRKWKVGEK